MCGVLLCNSLKGKNGEGMAYDADSASVIKLSNNYILYLREVNKYLALVCLMRGESWQASGLVEYNFSCFKNAIAQLFEVKNKFKQDQLYSSSSSSSAANPTAATNNVAQGMTTQLKTGQ